MIRSIKIKELEELATTWESWAHERVKEYNADRTNNSRDNYYCAAGMFTAAEELRKLIKETTIG